MLQGQGGDPDVVLGYRPALGAEILSHLRIDSGCDLVDNQNAALLDERREQQSQSLSVARSEKPETVLADHDHRQMVTRARSQNISKS